MVATAQDAAEGLIYILKWVVAVHGIAVFSLTILYLLVALTLIACEIFKAVVLVVHTAHICWVAISNFCMLREGEMYAKIDVDDLEESLQSRDDRIEVLQDENRALQDELDVLKVNLTASQAQMAKADHKINILEFDQQERLSELALLQDKAPGWQVDDVRKELIRARTELSDSQKRIQVLEKEKERSCPSSIAISDGDTGKSVATGTVSELDYPAVITSPRRSIKSPAATGDRIGPSSNAPESTPRRPLLGRWKQKTRLLSLKTRR